VLEPTLKPSKRGPATSMKASAAQASGKQKACTEGMHTFFGRHLILFGSVVVCLLHTGSLLGEGPTGEVSETSVFEVVVIPVREAGAW